MTGPPQTTWSSPTSRPTAAGRRRPSRLRRHRRHGDALLATVSPPSAAPVFAGAACARTARTGLLQVRLTLLLRDEVSQGECLYAEEVPAGVQAGRRHGGAKGRPDGPRGRCGLRRHGGIGASLGEAGRHRRWVVAGQTSSEQSEFVQLRGKMRRLEMENEILRRAAAYFAQNSLPK